MILCNQKYSIEIVFKNFDEGIFMQMFIDKRKSNIIELPIKMTNELLDNINRNKDFYISQMPPEINKLFSFFKDVKINEWFYIFPEEILKDKSNNEKEKLVDWCSLCLRYKNLGYSDEDIEEKMGLFEEHLKKYLFPLEKIYQMKAYTKVKKKIYFGCSNKKFRICRFCGKKCRRLLLKITLMRYLYRWVIIFFLITMNVIIAIIYLVRQ